MGVGNFVIGVFSRKPRFQPVIVVFLGCIPLFFRGVLQAVFGHKVVVVCCVGVLWCGRGEVACGGGGSRGGLAMGRLIAWSSWLALENLRKYVACVLF